MSIRAAITAILASIALVGCGNLSTRDTLELVIEVASLRMETTSAMVRDAKIPREVAIERLDFAQKAVLAMDEGLTLIEACAKEGGGCDLVKLRTSLGIRALDELEARLLRASEYNKAEVAGAAAIVLRIVQASQQPSPETAADVTRLRAMVTRFRAATVALAATLQQSGSNPAKLRLF